MAIAEFDIETPATPEQIRTAMLDFTERRPELWPGLAAKYYEVLSVGEAEAEIKEGTGFPWNVWAREHYDFSDPNTIEWTVQESNFCTAGSGVKISVAPSGSGSLVHVVWRREPTTLKGRIIIGMGGRNNGKLISKFIKQGLDNLPSKLPA